MCSQASGGASSVPLSDNDNGEHDDDNDEKREQALKHDISDSNDTPTDTHESCLGVQQPGDHADTELDRDSEAHNPIDTQDAQNAAFEQSEHDNSVAFADDVDAPQRNDDDTQAEGMDLITESELDLEEAGADDDVEIQFRDLLSDWVCAPFDTVATQAVEPGYLQQLPGFSALSCSSDTGLPVVPLHALSVAFAALLGARFNRFVHQPQTESIASVVGQRARPSNVSEEQQKRAQEAARRRREEAEAAEQARMEMQSQEFKDAIKREEERLKQQAEERRKQQEAKEEEQRRRREEARLRMEEEKQRREERKRREEEERLRREREAEEERKRRQAELEEERRRKEQEFLDRGGKRVRANVRGQAWKSGLKSVIVQASTLGQETQHHENDIGESALRMLCWRVALEMADAYKGEVQQQSLAGRGPLIDTPLDTPLLSHLSRWLASRTASAGTASAVRAARHGESQSFNSSVEFAILPESDEDSIQAQIHSAAEIASSTGPAAAADKLGELAAEEGASVLSTCLLCAHLLERHDTEETRSAAEIALIRRAKQEGDWRSFFLDSAGLEPGSHDAASAADMLFGRGSFVACVLRRICGQEAQANANAKTEEDFPDEAELRRMRREQVEAQTPVPERVWALRNSGSTLAQTGALGQAAEQLQRAVELKVNWLGEHIHPAVLGELRDLAIVLRKGGRFEESKALRKQQMRICTEAAKRLLERNKATDAYEVLQAALVELKNDRQQLASVPSDDAEASHIIDTTEITDLLESVKVEAERNGELEMEDLDTNRAAQIIERLAQRFSPKIEMHRRAGEAEADEEW